MRRADNMVIQEDYYDDDSPRSDIKPGRVGDTKVLPDLEEDEIAEQYVGLKNNKKRNLIQ